MGFLVNLFAKSRQLPDSYVSRWAKSKEREARHANKFTVEDLFAVMMYGATFLARIKNHKKAHIGELDIRKHYSYDSSAFELGCYLYFRLDLWLFKNKPHFREHISCTFEKEVYRLFAHALVIPSSTVSELFAERVKKYGELTRDGEDLKTYHFYLSQFILRTRDGILPQPYDSGHQVATLDAFEMYLVNTALLSWEQFMIPASIEAIENYCSLLEKN